MRNILLTFFISALFITPIPPVQAYSFTDFKDKVYDNFGVDLAGFMEGRIGSRLQRDLYQRDISIAETRLQLDLGKDIPALIGSMMDILMKVTISSSLAIMKIKLPRSVLYLKQKKP